MRRILLILGTALLAAVAAMGVTLFVSFRGLAPIADGRELGNGVRLVKDAIVSAAIVPADDDRSCILVDCGHDRHAAAIIAHLRRHGLGPEAVRAILLTHGHSDHVGGCSMFPHAEIFALAAERDTLEGRAGSLAPLRLFIGTNDAGLKISRWLEDQEVFQVGKLTITAYALPGHTPGSAAYLVNGTLFLGDSAETTSDGRLAPAKWIFTNSRSENRISLVQLARRLEPRASEVEWLVPSHSGPLAGLEPLLVFARRQ